MTFLQLNAAAIARFGATVMHQNAVAFRQLITSRSKRVKSLTDLVIYRNHAIDFESSILLDDFAKYLNGCPLAYITKQTTFCGLNLVSEPGVLAARSETQGVVWAIQQVIKQDGGTGRILDLCTGSGCIALAIAKAFPKCFVTGIDHSLAAIHLAQKNQQHLGLNNCTFVQMDFMTALQTYAPSVDYITCNPPYVSADDPALEQGVLAYEPRDAIIAQNNGYWFYQQFIKFFNQYALQPRAMAFEIGSQQAETLSLWMQTQRLSAYNLSVFKDHNEHPRVLLLSTSKMR